MILFDSDVVISIMPNIFYVIYHQLIINFVFNNTHEDSIFGTTKRMTMQKYPVDCTKLCSGKDTLLYTQCETNIYCLLFMYY